MTALSLLHAVHVPVVDTPGQQITHQHVGRQIPAVAPELQDHVFAPVQMLDHTVGGVVAGFFHQKVEPLEPAQPVM